MPLLSQVDQTDVDFSENTDISLLEKLPRSIKGIIAVVSIGVASGCSTSSSYRPNPTDQNLYRTNSGDMVYAPPKSLDIKTPSESSVSKSIIGAGVGYVACKVLGSSPGTSLGCAIVGGLVGGQSYDRTELERQDFHQLQRQIVRAYQTGLSAEPKIIDSLTRHVATTRKGMIGGVYHIRFKVQEVGTSGRVVRLYFVHATLKS